MKKASWVILAVVGALVTLGSLLSAWLAYGGADYPIGSRPLSEIASAHEGLGPALRSIRGTSAAYAAAYGVLFLAIVVGPYRRREVWAWWTILGGAAALAAITAARVLTLHVTAGLAAVLIQLAAVLVGLMLDVSRLREPR